MKQEYASKFIELHAHLDGAITTRILKRLAEIQGIPLPSSDDMELTRMISLPPESKDLNDFLKCFDLPGKYLQTAKGLTEAVRLVLEEMAEDGVIYAELRFAPQKSTNLGLTQREAIQAAVEGLKESPIPANLILCCMRGDDTRQMNEETIRLAHEFLTEDQGVVAVDLAGAEALFPTEDYRDLFAQAVFFGIPMTIHAGEAADPESVHVALDMGAVRIGHGVRAMEDPALLHLIREKGVTLEMAPTSNRQTGAVTDMSRYPLKRYLKEGIKVTINTDDPAIEGTTLSGEFRYIEKVFAITPEEERTLLSNAIDAAFTTKERKDWMREQLGLL